MIGETDVLLVIDVQNISAQAVRWLFPTATRSCHWSMDWRVASAR